MQIFFKFEEIFNLGGRENFEIRRLKEKNQVLAYFL